MVWGHRAPTCWTQIWYTQGEPNHAHTPSPPKRERSWRQWRHSQPKSNRGNRPLCPPLAFSSGELYHPQPHPHPLTPTPHRHSSRSGCSWLGRDARYPQASAGVGGKGLVCWVDPPSWGHCLPESSPFTSVTPICIKNLTFFIMTNCLSQLQSVRSEKLWDLHSAKYLEIC